MNTSAVKQRYGRLPAEEIIISYLKAVKIMIGADGEIAPEEMKALQAGMKRLGASDEVKATINDFDNEAADLVEVLPSMKKGGLRARMLLRDAIEISSADGVYAVEEKAAVAKAAELLGVGSQLLASIEALVELERGARHLRKALFPTRK